MPGVRRPRVPQELAERIDAVRGLVPFEVWVREALEQALAGTVEGVRRAKAADSAPVDPPRSRESATPARASECVRCGRRTTDYESMDYSGSAPVCRKCPEVLERVQESQRPGLAPGSSPAPPVPVRAPLPAGLAPARSFVKRVDPNALARQDLLNKR